ncbi:MAG TPA: SDR family NAD(P)-dependent oxidoreductase [Mycobacteriales bacterium]|nr:SDR family NAD(P)-dependent oxidoreductase [Mycobacteriales bacterium]
MADAIEQRYGPWAVVAGASDGVGAAFAEQLAAAGISVVLVARREALLEELAARLPVQTRVVGLDLSVPGAIDALVAATADLEVGLLVCNAGADTVNLPLLSWDLDELRRLVQRNCTAVLEASYAFGRGMVDRGRGGVVLVTSGAAWAGGATLAAYSATKAFDANLAESLWAEWHPRGVHVLSLVLGPTDTPALQRSLARHGGHMDNLADPVAVAVEAIAHLADGPTWAYGMPDPAGPSPLGTLSRREAVELMTAGAAAVAAEPGLRGVT